MNTDLIGFLLDLAASFVSISVIRTIRGFYFPMRLRTKLTMPPALMISCIVSGKGAAW